MCAKPGAEPACLLRSEVLALPPEIIKAGNLKINTNLRSSPLPPYELPGTDLDMQSVVAYAMSCTDPRGLTVPAELIMR